MFLINQFMISILLRVNAVFAFTSGFNDMEICGRFHQIPFSKMLTFYRKEPFVLEARYNAEDKDASRPLIGKVKIIFRVFWCQL